MKEKVLKAMREAGKPVSAGDITKMLNADRKDVDKAFAELKKEGAIVPLVYRYIQENYARGFPVSWSQWKRQFK